MLCSLCKKARSSSKVQALYTTVQNRTGDLRGRARTSGNITSSKVIFEHRSAFSGSPPISVAPRYTGEQRRVNTFIWAFIGGRCCNSHPVCQRKHLHLAKIAITSYIIARTLCISSIKEQWSRTTTTQGQMKRRRRRRTSLMLQSTAQAVPRNTTPSRIAMPRKVTGGSAPAK